MKKTVLILLLGILLIAGNLYAEQIDEPLTIMGNVGIGTAAFPYNGPVPQLLMHNPNYPGSYFQITNISHPRGFTFGLEGSDAIMAAQTGVGMKFNVNQGPFPSDPGYSMYYKSDGQFSINDFWPIAQLSVRGSTPLNTIPGTNAQGKAILVPVSGTVIVANGSPTVTGSGTKFSTEFEEGGAIQINNGRKDPWGQDDPSRYTIESINSDTSITLTSAYSDTGTSTAGLTINRDPNLFAVSNGAGETKLFVTRGGNVGIGTTNPQGYKLYVNGTVFFNSLNQSSDAQFKKNISPINKALDKIMNLKGVSYEWKKDEYKNRGFEDGRHYGVIAQDVETVLPEIVKENGDGYKGVSYTEMIPVMIEAMKEQQKEIKKLKAEVERLKAKDYTARVFQAN